jgi:GDP-mannose transporter
MHSNVETFIAFRSTPSSRLYRGHRIPRAARAPSLRTVACLATIAIGAMAYASAESGISIDAYGWAGTYLFIIVTEMVYAKHVIHSVGLSTWGLVMYQNLISTLIRPFAAVMSGEASQYMALLMDNPPFMDVLYPVDRHRSHARWAP